MADTSNLTKFLGDVADAIRTVKETTNKIPAENFDTEILSIESGIDTSDATAVAGDIVSGKTAYVGNQKIEGTMSRITYLDNSEDLGIRPPTVYIDDMDGTQIFGLSATPTNMSNEESEESIRLTAGYMGPGGSTTDQIVIIDLAQNIAEAIGLTSDKLVKGEIVLGVEGAAEGELTKIPVKLFETKEEMDADTTSEVGQLGVIYRNITTPMAEGMTTDRVGYPRIVTLDTTHGQFGTGLTGTGGDIAVSGSASYSSGRINIQLNDVIVEYTSEDALHWVRQSGPHTQYFGSPVTFTAVWAEEAWPMLGHFMVKQDLYQDGLYEYNGTSWEVAPNQFTLVTDTHLMQDLVAYGRDGVVTGTFAGGAKIYPDVQTLLDTYGEPVGDLGLVYGYKEYSLQNGNMFKKVKFNKTVTFSEDVRDKFFDFSNPDGDWMSGFQIEIGGNYMSIRANDYSFWLDYSTIDNLTYTTTDDVSGWYEFPSVVTCMYDWDDGLSQLMSIQMRSFDGLYEVREGYDSNATYVLDFSKSPTVTKKEGRVIRTSDIQGVLDLIDFQSKDLNAVEIYYDGTYHYAMCASGAGAFYTLRDLSTNKVYWTVRTNLSYQFEENQYLYKIDLATNTIVSATPFSSIATSANLVSSDGCYKLAEVTLNEEVYIVDYSKTAEYHIESEWAIWRVASYGSAINSNDTYYIDNLRVPVTKYFTAPTQFSALADDVLHGKIFYGKNGVEEGMLAGNISTMFNDMAAEIYAEAQDIYDNMVPLVASNSNKKGGLDDNVKIIPSKRDGTPLLDTSAVTNATYMLSNCKHLVAISGLNTSNITDATYMFSGCSALAVVPILDMSSATTVFGMFRGCTKLTTVPILNISNVIDVGDMFTGCNNLSDDSLNNILAMCANATKMQYNKTLKRIGLSNTQATKCTTLSNYSAFTAAGWTTGY